MTPPRKSFLKIIFAAGIILIPIALTLAVFKPLISRHNAQSFREKYSLPGGFSKEALARIVEHMRSDGEFAFSFAVLGRRDIEQAAVEVYRLLSPEQRGPVWHALIVEQQDKVLSLAVLLDHMEWGEELFKIPELDPKTLRLVREFLYEEFKLSVMSVCYKSVFEEDFHLIWPEEAVTLAGRVRTAFGTLNRDELTAVQVYFDSLLPGPPVAENKPASQKNDPDI